MNNAHSYFLSELASTHGYLARDLTPPYEHDPWRSTAFTVSLRRLVEPVRGGSASVT